MAAPLGATRRAGLAHQLVVAGAGRRQRDAELLRALAAADVVERCVREDRDDGGERRLGVQHHGGTRFFAVFSSISGGLVACLEPRSPHLDDPTRPIPVQKAVQSARNAVPHEKRADPLRFAPFRPCRGTFRGVFGSQRTSKAWSGTAECNGTHSGARAAVINKLAATVGQAA